MGSSDFDRYLNKFERRLENKLGSSLKKPRTVALGYLDENNVTYIDVPANKADQPNMYYFHELTNETAVGQAFLSTEANIESGLLRYNLPIRIIKDEEDDMWVIKGVAPTLGSHYIDSIVSIDYNPIDLNEFLHGLLVQTEPKSMKARVIGAFYNLDGESYYVPTTETVDFSTTPWSSYITVSTGQARYVLVEVNPVTQELVYTPAAGTVPASLLHKQIAALDAGTGTYLPAVTSNRFRAGYVKLIYGMTLINRDDNIWALQEVYTKTSTDSIGANVLSWIVVDSVTGNVVTDDLSGQVIWDNS